MSFSSTGMGQTEEAFTVGWGGEIWLRISADSSSFLTFFFLPSAVIKPRAMKNAGLILSH